MKGGGKDKGEGRGMEGEKERGREREMKKGAGEGEKGGGEQGVREGGKKKKLYIQTPDQPPLAAVTGNIMILQYYNIIIL